MNEQVKSGPASRPWDTREWAVSAGCWVISFWVAVFARGVFTGIGLLLDLILGILPLLIVIVLVTLVARSFSWEMTKRTAIVLSYLMAVSVGLGSVVRHAAEVTPFGWLFAMAAACAVVVVLYKFPDWSARPGVPAQVDAVAGGRNLITDTADRQGLSVADDLRLHAEAAAGRTDSVRRLLESGADVNRCAIGGLTPLHTAIRFGEIDCVLALLEYGADPNAATDQANRPLHAAVYKGSVEIAAMLLEYGADINGLGPGGFTPSDGAVAQGDAEMLSFLLARGGHRARTL